MQKRLQIVFVALAVVMCFSADAEAQVLTYGAVTQVKVTAGSPVTLQSLASSVYAANLKSGLVQQCSGNLTFSSTSFAPFKLANNFATCRKLDYVNAPSAPSSTSGFSIAADAAGHDAAGAISHTATYWLIDNATGIVQLCATLDGTPAGTNGSDGVYCVAAKTP